MLLLEISKAIKHKR